jgi:pyridoxal biosynthesis lyase PdxS
LLARKVLIKQTATDGTTTEFSSQSTNQTLDLRSFCDAQSASPLAAALLRIQSVEGVFLGSDIIAVNIADATQ